MKISRCLLLLLALSAFPLPGAEPSELDLAFGRMYNFDFTGAHRFVDQRLAKQPDDHFAHVTRACAYLFVELDRMGILESSFLADDERIAEKKKKIPPDPLIRQKFMASLETAQKLADSKLANGHEDADALFSLAISNGLILDYFALIEKRQIASLSYARQAQAFGVRALRANPRFVDAHLTQGVSEYLLGSVPFFVRWFLRLDDVEGDKRIAVTKLKKVAAEGRFMGPFARILLSVISLREKRTAESVQYLRDLARDFPENPLIRKELTIWSARLTDSPAAR